MEKARSLFLVILFALVFSGLAYTHGWFNSRPRTGPAASTSGPTRDVPLPGGGTSDGSKCGVKGYHYFPVTTVMDTGATQPDTPAGPQMVLGSYGASQSAGTASFTISLLFGTGSAADSPLYPAAPLGAQGVAIEIEGPNGLVGGGHNLPVTLQPASARQPNGTVRLNGGLSASVTLPALALCPGYDVMTVGRNLSSPMDSHNTVTGQPLYTLTVSISDPAIARARVAIKSTASGPVLAANNLMPAGSF